MFGFPRRLNAGGRDYPFVSRDDGLIRALGAVVVLAVVGVLALRIVGHLRPRAPDVGYPLEMMALEPLTPQAQPVALDDLRGKVVLINYWATWCAPCVEEFPLLESLAAGYARRDDFRFLSVSTGHADDALLRETEAFLRARNSQLPVYRDPQNMTRAGLHDVAIDVMPLTVLLDRETKVAKVVTGNSRAELEELKLQIATLLQAK